MPGVALRCFTSRHRSVIATGLRVSRWEGLAAKPAHNHDADAMATIPDGVPAARLCESGGAPRARWPPLASLRLAFSIRATLQVIHYWSEHKPRCLLRGPMPCTNKSEGREGACTHYAQLGQDGPGVIQEFSAPCYMKGT